MRFGDGLYYVMVPSSRSKGVLPIDKAGRLVRMDYKKKHRISFQDQVPDANNDTITEELD